MCFMVLSNQFIRVIFERVNNHICESGYAKARCPFCFGTVPFLLQHPALLKS